MNNTVVVKYNNATKAYYDAAIAYSKASVEYYAYAGAVEENAKEDYDAAVDVIEDKKDDEGNVTEEGLKTKISKSESDTTGTTLTNLEAYAKFEDYLVATLGYNYEAELMAEARDMLDEQIRVYAVAKKLQETVVVNGYKNDDLGVDVKGYKAAIEDSKELLKEKYTHELTHDDPDMKSGKIERKFKKYWKELLKSTDFVFVNNKAYNNFKNEIGTSNYNYYKEQYGDNNLRMYLQFENLLEYLLYKDYQVNEYAIHEGEYTVLEVKDGDNKYTGKLGYLFITYDFKTADAE